MSSYTGTVRGVRAVPGNPDAVVLTVDLDGDERPFAAGSWSAWRSATATTDVSDGHQRPITW